MSEYDTGIRKLPFSMYAEQALLGSLMIDSEKISEITDRITADDFYLSEHKAIFSAMVRLASTGRAVDAVTLIDSLEKEKIYDRAGAENYLKTLTEAVPSAINLEDYLRIVVEKSIKRQLIDICGGVSERAFTESEKADELIEYASAKLDALSAGKRGDGFSDLVELLNKVYDDLEALSKNKEAFEGVNTGYSNLDSLLCGIGNTDFVIIGARPGMGKTSLALNIATNVAMNYRKKVAIFSLEMSDEQIASRILSSQAMVTGSSMRSGTLDRSEWNRLSKTVEMLSDVRIVIDDTPDITVSEMKSKVRREKDIDMIVIDYLQLMQGEKHTDNRVLEIGDITRNMKLMAKELKVPVICAAQLSRSVEKNNTSNKRPMMSDLRDSGTIEQDADTILFIYRDEYYKSNGNAGKEPDTETPVAEIIVAKNRHGSTGNVKLNWIGKYTRFYSVDKVWSDEDAPPEFASGHPEG